MQLWGKKATICQCFVFMCKKCLFSIISKTWDNVKNIVAHLNNHAQSLTFLSAFMEIQTLKKYIYVNIQFFVHDDSDEKCGKIKTVLIKINRSKSLEWGLLSEQL